MKFDKMKRRLWSQQPKIRSPYESAINGCSDFMPQSHKHVSELVLESANCSLCRYNEM